MNDARHKYKNQQGFTLVEVMVALLIFSILSAATLAVLTSTLQSKTQMQAQQETLRARAIVRILLKEDFAQTVIIPKKDAYGQVLPVFFSGGNIGDNRLLTLSRTGWGNPGGIERRSDLQAVDYRLEKGILIRRTAMRFNGADISDPKQYLDQALLPNIERIDMQFYDGAEWTDNWVTGPLPGVSVLPKLASITLHFQDGNDLRQIFIIGADQ